MRRGSLDRRFQKNRDSILLGWSLFFAYIVYRFVLYAKFASLPVGPAMFVPDMHPFTAMLYNIKSDFEVAVGFALVHALISALPGLRAVAVGRKVLRLLFLFGVGFNCMAQYQLLISLSKGVDVTALQELRVTPMGSLFTYATPLAVFFLFNPFLVDLAFGFIAKVERRYVALRTAIIVLVVAAYLLRIGPRLRTPREIFANPTVYLAESVGKLLKMNELPFHKYAGEVSHEQKKQIRFVDDDLVSPPQQRSRSLVVPIEGSPKKWNVIVVMMESTGESYVLGRDAEGRTPMPFLTSLRAEGLSLADHRSVSNTSFRSIFSILTGLYPELDWTNFSLRLANCVPSIFDVLGEDYTRFMVLGSYSDFFFPKSLILNSDLGDFADARSLQGPQSRPRPPEALNDLDSLDAFVERLERAKPPFVAAFMPHGPHYEYFDYEPDHRYIKEPQSSLDAYKNNLHTLDRSIEKLFEALRKKGVLDETIVVFAGDHGEAFGQHPGNITHSRYMFEENVRVPAFFWQPKLFRSGVVLEPTDHTDLLPTLLDAMGSSVDLRLFQGTALGRWVQQKRILPGFGNDSTLCTLNTLTRRKVCLNVPNALCQVFELSLDPEERDPKPCDEKDQQLLAALRIQKYHSVMLENYNQAIISGASHFGDVSLENPIFSNKRSRPNCQLPR
jgi:phosphoglycerol transferase MdoB-like AlkP superfamily enzyme